MSVGKVISYEDLRSLAFGGIGANYAAVGTPFEHPVRQIKVTNLTNENLKISFDAIATKDIAPAQSQYVYDYASNKSAQGGDAIQKAGESLYVKREAAVSPTSGTVYVTIIYTE